MPLGDLIAQQLAIARLGHDRCRDVVEDRAGFLLAGAQVRIQKSARADVVAELPVFEEHVHALVERVAKDLEQLLMDVRIRGRRREGEGGLASRQGQCQRSRAACPGEDRQELDVAFGWPESDRHVVRAGERFDRGRGGGANVGGRQRAFPHDNGMDELDGDVRRVRCIRTAAERIEPAALQEAFRHRLAGAGDARRLDRKVFANDRVALAQPRCDARLLRAPRQHILGSGSPTSMSITRVPP